MTDLEHCILGIIWRDGPMSAYDVRVVFARSATPMWGSSAGSVYPAIRRLEAGGLVRSAEPQGTRNKQLISVSERGVHTLKRWLLELGPGLGAATPDPIRTRLQFIHALEGREAHFLQEALALTEEAIVAAEGRRRQLEADGAERLKQLAVLGVLFELKARRDWLLAISTSFESKLAPSSVVHASRYD